MLMQEFLDSGCLFKNTKHIKISYVQHGREKFPDPLTMKTGWLREDNNGLMKWHSIYFLDIRDFLKTRTSADLMKHLVNGIKKEKPSDILAVVG